MSGKGKGKANAGSAAAAAARRATSLVRLGRINDSWAVHQPNSRHAGQPDWTAIAEAYNAAYGTDVSAISLKKSWNRAALKEEKKSE